MSCRDGECSGPAIVKDELNLHGTLGPRLLPARPPSFQKGLGDALHFWTSVGCTWRLRSKIFTWERTALELDIHRCLSDVIILPSYLVELCLRHQSCHPPSLSSSHRREFAFDQRRWCSSILFPYLPPSSARGCTVMAIVHISTHLAVSLLHFQAVTFLLDCFSQKLLHTLLI